MSSSSFYGYGDRMIVRSNLNGYVAYLTKVLKTVFLPLYCSACGEIHRDSSTGKSKTGLNLKKYLIKIKFLWPENKNIKKMLC